MSIYTYMYMYLYCIVLYVCMYVCIAYNNKLVYGNISRLRHYVIGLSDFKSYDKKPNYAIRKSSEKQ